MKKIAVILCGSGFKDGSEIRESVGTLWALSKSKSKFQCFALNENQHHVVNCFSGEVANQEKRNQLVESARIARGSVKPLEELLVSEWDAIVLPGGFGAAKNLCDYAFKGVEASVHPQIEGILKEFNLSKKPIGAICIAPMILALTFKSKGFELSVGSDNDAVKDIVALGHSHINLNANQAHVDLKNKVVTTPAYMHDSAPLDQIFEGIDHLVKHVIDLA